MALLKTTFSAELIAMVLLITQHEYVTLSIAVIALLLLVWHIQRQKGNSGEREKL